MHYPPMEPELNSSTQNEPGQSKAECNPTSLTTRLAEQAKNLQRLNDELVDWEQRLRLAVETGRIGIWAWDTTGADHSLDWSPRLKEIFGMAPNAEVTRDIFLRCVHHEDRERVDWAIMQALSGVNNGAYDIEYRVIHPDGSLHWVTAQGQAFFDEKGKTIRFIGAVVDVSDRKQVEEYTARLNRELEDRVVQRTSDLLETNRILVKEVEERERAEQVLRQSDDDFRRVIDAIPGLVWSSLPDGHIDYLNKTWLDYTGLTHEQAIGWGWQQAVHPDDIAGLLVYWKSILVGQIAGEYEARLRRFDGHYRWVLFRGVPFRDGDGNVFKWYGTNTDIQDLRASEHLAKGQAFTLTKTLELLSQETDPEQLPKHVVTTIANQMDAHSVTIWERSGKSLNLMGTYEDGQFQTATDINHFGGSIPVFADAPRMLTEGLNSGELALIKDLSKAPVQFTMGDGRVAVWEQENLTPSFIAHKTHLLAQGVRAMLVSPLMLGGTLAGIIGIRFKGSRDFGNEEIALMKALAHQAMLAIQLMHLSRQSRKAAIVGERNRLARDIHDTLAQGLTGIIVQLEASEDAKSKGITDEADQHVKRASQLARDSLQEARASVHALRPRALADQHLCSALAELIQKTTEGTPLCATFSAQGEPQRLPDAWEQHLFRMVQEALANVQRHSGATQFNVLLVFKIEEIRLELSDNGRGFEVSAGHLGMGLRGLQDRTDAMGGILTIESAPGQGTKIGVVLPTVVPAKETS